MKNRLCSLLSFFISKKKSPQCSQLPEDICRQFSLAEIKAATNNFHPDTIIATSYFGSIVYEGTIDDGTIVAIRRCGSSFGGGASELQLNEVQLLCQLRHPHLVSLIGFCLVEKEMFVVLEYMSRGSLADLLYGVGKDFVPLTWKHRLQICIDAARGLHYLHTGAKRSVIHHNIKSSNILLDQQRFCKLSDFGLSKLVPLNTSKASIRIDTDGVLRTCGYMAPEYCKRVLTEKSDVYSFGIVLYEVLFGRPHYDSTLPEEKQHLLVWAMESLIEGTIYHAIDPYLKGRIAPECLNKYLEIASSCVRHKGNERPVMGEVEATLELALELQERADSEMEAMNPCGQCMYDEASISASLRNILGFNGHNFTDFGFHLSDSDSNNVNNNS
ncbi:receptor-like protein kinase FERONIA [Hibiscus syriacus]|uniref:receptor-like protein kinase FERONIA n=1 Tax=Hibiscus syriacus TaxID=106335 RepID=UPI001922E706|nr:receptor-like protein kinase FERONIA [Hibiscus syriacus]